MSRLLFLRRVLPAIFASALVWALLANQYWAIQEFIVDLATANGQSVSRISGMILYGPAGPFGDHPQASIWNWLWRNAPLVIRLMSVLLVASLLLSLTFGPLRRSRAFGYRGSTRCGRCGYALQGLAQPMCPECGQSIDHVN